jgi:hypothetical protein
MDKNGWVGDSMMTLVGWFLFFFFFSALYASEEFSFFYLGWGGIT